MKQKLALSEKALWDKATWLVYILFALLFIGTPTKVKAETLNALEVKEMAYKPKNRNVSKYHRNNNRIFTCSLCEKKRFLGIFKMK